MTTSLMHDGAGPSHQPDVQHSDNAMTAAERKKRTRPVSACESCRSKKVKCNLLPDRPVCINCESSGKQCLFRVDDLSPALRRERFSEYNEPAKPSLPPQSHRRRKSRRKSSLLSTHRDDDNGDADVRAGSNETAKDEQEEHGQEGRTAKTKAVFRCFANPTKLAAPSVPMAQASASEKYAMPDTGSDTPRSSVSAHNVHTDGTSNTAIYYNHNGHDSHDHTWMQQFLPMDQARSAAGAARHSRRNTVDIPWGMPGGISFTPASVATALSHEQQQQRQHLDTPRSEFNLPESYAGGLSRPMTHRSYSDAAVIGPLSAASTKLDAMPMNLLDVEQNASDIKQWDRHVAAMNKTTAFNQHSNQMPSDTYDGAQGPSAFSNLQIPAYSTDTRPRPSGEAEPDSWLSQFSESQGSSDKLKNLSHFVLNETMSPSVQQTESPLLPINTTDNVAPDTSAVRKPSPLQSSAFSPGEPQSAHGSAMSTASKPPMTFRKIALPFFRWFGATANTPGIRRIKVGVYHDAEGESSKSEPMLDEAASAGGYSTPSLAAQDFAHRRDRPLWAASAVPDGMSGMVSTPHSDMTPLQTGSNDAQPHTQAQASETTMSSSVRELFESERPRYPRRDILLHLTELFLKLFKESCFPWLDSTELVSGASSGELPAIIANAICALTIRFSNRADLKSVKNPTEAYSDMAKILVVPMLSWPSIDVIEVLIMLSYVEFATGADAGLWMYIGMALRMATDLGLQHELTVQSMATQRQKDRARYIFWSIVSLDRITCFGTGRPVTMRDDAYDCELPPLSEDVDSDGYVFNHIVRLLLHRGQIGELLNRREEGQTRRLRSIKLRELWKDLATFHETLPGDLQFGVTSFRKLAAVDKGTAFVYLHVLLQSTISLINRPSLLRRFDKDHNAGAPSELAKIANHASATIASILRFAADAGQHGMQVPPELSSVNIFVDCNPFLDQLVLPAGRALLAERESAADALRSLSAKSDSQADASTCARSDEVQGNASASNSLRADELLARRQYADLHLSSCQQMLNRIAKWWWGAAWPARALRQETLGAGGDDNGPDGTDEEAQPAPIRDVEMVLKWAKARRLRATAELATPDHRAAESSQAVRRSTLQGRLYSQDGDATQVKIAHLLKEAQRQQSSSLGLGVSGSMGAESNFDVDTLINAWARELDGVDSSAAWVPQASSTQPRANATSSTTISGALSRLVGTPGPLDAPMDKATGSQAHASDGPAITQPWSDASGSAIDFNFNGMQLEEFLFDPYSSKMRAAGQNAHQSDEIGAANLRGQIPYDKAGSFSTHDDQTQALFAGSSTPLSTGRLPADDGSSRLLQTIVSEQDLRSLPPALLNAFTFPPSGQVYGGSF